MLSVRTKLCNTCVSGDWEFSFLGSSLRSHVVIICVCCEWRLFRSELMSCAGSFRSTMSRASVVMIPVCVLGMYVFLDKEALRRGGVLSARSKYCM